MGRDTIQLETAVSTISQEYLLEFTSEYGISEDLHPEVTAPGDRIVDFPEDKIGQTPRKNTPQCYTRPLDSLKNWNNRFFWVDERVFPTVVDWRESAPKDEKPAEGSYSVEDVARLDTQMNLFNLISALNPAKIRTGTRPRATHEVPLLTVTANRVIDMEEPATATESSGTPSTIERSPLDFANENPSHQINEGDRTKDQVLETGASEVPPTGHASTMGVLRKDFDVSRPTQSTFREKSFASMGLEAGSTLSAASHRKGLLADSEEDLLLSTSHCWVAKADYIREMGRITQQLPRFEHHRDASARTRYNVKLDTQVLWVVPSCGHKRSNKSIPTAEESPKKSIKRIKRIPSAREEEIKKLDTKVQGLRNQTRNLEILLEAEEALCAEMNARLDALIIRHFERGVVHPHMLTAYKAGRTDSLTTRSYTPGSLMKCAESTDLR
ncbi:hypothetical protein Tco_1144479 [Tanacetum coccineum]